MGPGPGEVGAMAVANDLARDFEKALKKRFNDFWSLHDDFGGISPEQASAMHRLGLDPALKLPRPVLREPGLHGGDWQPSVPFDEYDVNYWPDCTAILVTQASWGSLEDDRVTFFPSMGEMEQFKSGLMGSVSLLLPETRPGSRMVQVGTVGAYRPIWETEAPRYYSFEYESVFEEAVARALPPDLRSPFLLDLAIEISFALGWLTLVHGLRSVFQGWQDLNSVLASTRLRGFSSPD